MNYVILTAIVFTSFIQNVLRKQYSTKVKDKLSTVFMFYTFMSAAALVFFVIAGGFKFSFNASTVISGVVFGVTYVIACVFSLLAIMYGSLTLTSLMISYSLIIPAAYCLIFMNEPFTPSIIIGIALFIISLLLINLGNGDKADIKITPRWCLYAFLAFAGNGACITVQKVHQVNFPGLYRSEFMIVAMVLSTAVCLVMTLCLLKKGTDAGYAAKQCLLYAVPTGIANAAANFMVMFLSIVLPASLMYPVISAGVIILTFIVSLTLFKERQTKMQYVGFFAGVLSVIILNL